MGVKPAAPLVMVFISAQLLTAVRRVKNKITEAEGIAQHLSK